MCRIIYCYLAAVQVSSDIFAHHQEHLKCITASGITHVCRCQLAATYVCNIGASWLLVDITLYMVSLFKFLCS
jgi:hypothetical protein